MAANQVSKKRKSSKSHNSCPKAMLNIVPSDCTKLKFSDLKPGDDYKFKAIIGKIQHLYPLGKRSSGFVRKLLVIDALSESDENCKRLTIFLLDQFAKDSNAAEVDGFIAITNFKVENLNHQTNTDFPLQVLVVGEESQVWFARKVNTKGRKNSKSPNPRKKQRTSDMEEPTAVQNQYEYTKLGDLTETDPKELLYNVYGIVDSCDLRIPQGKKMQILDLTLTDQTETGFSCAVFAGSGEFFPDVYPGDIVRIHRMQVNKFRGRLRGRCPDPKFILVFSKDNQGENPRTVAKTFTFTPEDITRFRELFDWFSSKTAPKLISEINKDDFINFVCQVVGVYVARTSEAVILKVWDGTKTLLFPGTHWGMKEEVLDQQLFTLARNYYVVLSVYGQHTQKAAELKPGQFIEVKDAHLYNPKNNPDEIKLCLHAGNHNGRGIFMLEDNEDKVLRLKERLEQVISETLEFGNQTADILSQNNSIFLNCDISAFSQNTQSADKDNEVMEVTSQSEEPVSQNGTDIEVLNEPLSRSKVSIERTVVSVVNASIKPGQATQEFGLGMPRDETMADDDIRISVTSEPDPLCNMTPLQARYFPHDPLQLGSQITSSIFSASSDPSSNEWWNSVPTVSVTDGHSDINPTSLASVVEHIAPYKFRVYAVVLGFKPETTSIEKFIHLYCPNCMYISEDTSPPFDPCETRDGLAYYFCPECSIKAEDSQKPVLEYTFLILFSLHDGTGPPFIEVYMWKENAVKFFRGTTPEEALKDSATADSILHMLWNICPNCKPFNSSAIDSTSVYPVLDCSIFSYHAAGSTQYQMFDTILL